MLKKIQIAGFVWITMFFTIGTANANLLRGYSDWKKMSPDYQAAYVMGLVDMASTTVVGENEGAATGVVNCWNELKLTPNMVIEAMTKFYQDRTDSWGVAPAIVFYHSVRQGICLVYVNAERAKLGLPLWPKG